MVFLTGDVLFVNEAVCEVGFTELVCVCMGDWLVLCVFTVDCGETESRSKQYGNIVLVLT